MTTEAEGAKDFMLDHAANLILGELFWNCDNKFKLEKKNPPCENVLELNIKLTDFKVTLITSLTF